MQLPSQPRKVQGIRFRYIDSKASAFAEYSGILDKIRVFEYPLFAPFLRYFTEFSSRYHPPV
jgi:hypothetical protein